MKGGSTFDEEFAFLSLEKWLFSNVLYIVNVASFYVIVPLEESINFHFELEKGKEGRRKLRIKIRFRKSSLRQNKHSLEMPKFTFHYIWNMIVIFVDRLSHCKPYSSNESVVCSQWCHKVSCVIGIQDRKHFDSPGCWITWSLLYHGWVNRLIDLLNHLPQRRKLEEN